jgi:hypothetical protein
MSPPLPYYVASDTEVDPLISSDHWRVLPDELTKMLVVLCGVKPLLA